MRLNDETRRVGRRASENVLDRNNSEVSHQPLLFNQAARIARRFVVSEALSRVIAEHAYASGGRAHG